MATSGIHQPEALTRYALKELTGQEQEILTEHLERCGPCRQFASFIRRFHDVLQKGKGESPTAGEACPEPALIVTLAAGELSQDVAKHVDAHLLFCRACRDEFYAASRMIEPEEETKPKFIEAILRKARGFIDCLRVSERADWKQLPAMGTLKGGKSVITAPFQVRETVVDPDSEEEVVMVVRLEEAVASDRMRVIVETDTVPGEEEKWELVLTDGDEKERTSMPLDEREVEVHAALPYGLYILEVRKGTESLVRFRFTVEPFSLPEAVETAHEYLESGEYSRALAILDDAADRFPESQEVLEVRAVAHALAWKDAETFERDRKNLGHVLAGHDFFEETLGVLTDLKSKVGESAAYLIALQQLDPGAVPEDAEKRIAKETSSLLVLQAFELLRDRLEILEKRTHATDERTMQLLNDAVRRVNEFSLLLDGLTEKINAVRAKTDEDVDHRFWEIGDVLQHFPEDVAKKGMSLPDYKPFFREKLGEACWSWLGGQVQKMFVTAEDLYWYLGRRPAYQSPDFSPSLLEFCRGLEVLLNDKLGMACTDVRNLAQTDVTLADIVRAKLPNIYLDKLLRPERSRAEKTLGLQDLAIFLRMGQVIARERTGALSQHAPIFTGTSAITSLEFFAVVSHIGVNIRNGKSHKSLTSADEMYIVRKLILGFAEEEVSGDILGRIRNAPWFTTDEAVQVSRALSATWAKYPGLVRIVWTALKASPPAQA